MFDVLSEARAVQPQVVAWRRQFHRRPELSMQEFVTTGAIAEALKKMGLEPKLLTPTGCIAEIRGAKSGPTMALRADIDALAVEELGACPFKSENPGRNHACGHDTHAAMLLGTAEILRSHTEDLAGTVRLIFQPGEETGEGAKAVIAQGGMDGVAACFAVHIFSQSPPGILTTKAGGMFPAVGQFKITVTGKTCHGAMPHVGADATVAASAVVMNLQSIVSREVNPLTPVVVSVGSFHSGTIYNAISGEAVMEGTVRLFDEALHRRMPDILARIAHDTAGAFRCAAKVDYIFGSRALITDEDVTHIAQRAALKLLPDPEMLLDWPGAMGGEDFAEYTSRVPCSYVGLGGGGNYPQHNERFEIDEEAMVTGTALNVQFALDFGASKTAAR